VSWQGSHAPAIGLGFESRRAQNFFSVRDILSQFYHPGQKATELLSRQPNPGSKTGTNGPLEPGQMARSVVVIGIKDITKMNLSLLCKWWWKLETEEGLWQTLVRTKYIKNRAISTIPPRLDDSPMWKDLLKVRNIYLAGRKPVIQNGENVLFWLECWLETDPLCLKYPVLFELNECKHISVAEFVRKNGYIPLEDGFLQFFMIIGSC